MGLTDGVDFDPIVLTAKGKVSGPAITSSALRAIEVRMIYTPTKSQNALQ